MFSDHRCVMVANVSVAVVVGFFSFATPAKDCGGLQAPVNGSSVGSNTTYPNEMRFSCDVGFVLSGSSARRCLANGSWSGEAAVCTGEHESCCNVFGVEGLQLCCTAVACLIV